MAIASSGIPCRTQAAWTRSQILAAVAFALVLYKVVTDDQTKNALLRVVIDWMGQLSAFLPQ